MYKLKVMKTKEELKELLIVGPVHFPCTTDIDKLADYLFDKLYPTYEQKEDLNPIWAEGMITVIGGCGDCHARQWNDDERCVHYVDNSCPLTSGDFIYINTPININHVGAIAAIVEKVYYHVGYGTPTPDVNFYIQMAAEELKITLPPYSESFGDTVWSRIRSALPHYKPTN